MRRQSRGECRSSRPGFVTAYRSTVAVALVALLAGCSGAPSESAGRQTFEARIQKEVGSTPFSIDAFQKTNGQEVNLGGVTAYRLFYSSTVSFPEGYRPECVSDGNRFPGFDCWLGFAAKGGVRPQPRGAAVTYSGEIDFQKTENGWVADSVTIRATP